MFVVSKYVYMFTDLCSTIFYGAVDYTRKGTLKVHIIIQHRPNTHMLIYYKRLKNAYLDRLLN